MYHNPTCTTCRRTISELERAGLDIEKRNFFKNPFSASELKRIVKMTGKKPAELLRKKDKMYKELGLGNQDNTYTDSQIIKLMAKHPGLIMRPIIIVPTKNKVLVGKVTPTDLEKLA